MRVSLKFRTSMTTLLGLASAWWKSAGDKCVPSGKWEEDEEEKKEKEER